ncbi:MAG: hypothetical protein K0R09_893 [Clostridiales bacterium]|jgi:uncharacterized protein (DUF1697 family)|nr:hypothetical protein [Clostridiales bacterium]
MKIYIALLRGINVGGKNIIKMVDLKHVFQEIGLLDVQTYIQSGNVLFKSNQQEEWLINKIEHNINKTFRFSVKVVLRTASELEGIVQNCPFSKEAIAEAELSSEGESLYISLMTRSLSQEKIELLNYYNSENEECKIQGREVYLLFHNSIRNSKHRKVIEKMDVSATVRNWKTLSKLNLLAKDMQD